MMRIRFKDGKDARTWILFLGGLVGVGYETIVAQVDRPTLLVIFASMMGLPLFLRRDQDPPAPPPPAVQDGPASEAK